jgi:peroxiredoxin
VSELQGLQLSLEEFKRRGTPVVAIVSDPLEGNDQQAVSANLQFPILADPELVATDAYGLRHREAHDGHDIARSASVVIDRDGIVRWTHVAPNVRVRPLPSEILAQIDSLGAAR